MRDKGQMKGHRELSGSPGRRGERAAGEAKTKVAVIGAGGHGKIVGSVVILCPDLELACFVDSFKKSPDERVLGKEIITSLDALKDSGYAFIVAIGDGQKRKEWYDEVKKRKLPLMTVIHPTAAVHPLAKIGEGCFVGPLAIINVDALIGVDTIINSGAIIEHDNVIGNHCHIAPNASLAGNVKVGDFSFVGIGSSVREKMVIGKRSQVGAGACVVKDVPDDVLVVGVPAQRLVR
jgi:sugar O-acyltransferase (sialic acid O-acetyltransferase NeuD family)